MILGPFSLDQIFESGYPCRGRKPFLDDIIAENIRYIMRTKRLWRRGYNVVIPPGGALYEFSGNTYQVDFEIFKRGQLIYRGTAYGRYQVSNEADEPCDTLFEIVDMEIELEPLSPLTPIV